jgi:ribosomal protein S3
MDSEEMEMFTGKMLKDKLSNMGADELPIKVNTYDGAPITIWTARKHVVTDEEGKIVDAYIVLNG